MRLVVRVELGLRELLLIVKPTRYTPMINRGRRRQAEALCRQIIAMRAPSDSSKKAALSLAKTQDPRPKTQDHHPQRRPSIPRAVKSG